MSVINSLSRNAKGSISHWVDRTTRKHQPGYNCSYSSSDVQLIVNEIVRTFNSRYGEKAHYNEIVDSLNSTTLRSDIEACVINLLNHRPSKERVEYLIKLRTPFLNPRAIPNVPMSVEGVEEEIKYYESK